MSYRRSRASLLLASVLSFVVSSALAAGCSSSDDDAATGAKAGAAGAAGSTSGTGGTAGGQSGVSGTSGNAGTGAGGVGGTSGVSGTGGASGTGAMDAGTDAPVTDLFCDQQGLPKIAFSAGPYGVHRLDLAADFTVPLLDGTSWTLSQAWTGCESYVLLPDSIKVSDQDSTSIWENDLATLVKKSPKNVHYFFVSRSASDATAMTNLTAMQGRVDALLATLSADDADHWRARLHVVATRSGSLDNWIGDIMGGIGALGIAIDRGQRVRGVGYLADVHRFDQALSDAMLWPYKLNLASARHEPEMYNAEALQQVRLDAENATVVPFWTGETLAGFAETDVLLPTAEQMAGFDTLEVDVQIQCPDPDKVEFNNCGAWDYLAKLFVQDASMTNVEIARFITSYHRETHWVVDASAMLTQLKQGGMRHFRWEFAPTWNTQPSATKLSLRFSNQGKNLHPTTATYLFGGGPFTSTYNDGYMPVDVPIPATAKKVELWAIITGHGGEANNCSEFCNHKHDFTVNGTLFAKTHPEAGTADKCEAKSVDGLVPNQAGTWWYGRGGWCPGMRVDPWVTDVTTNVTPGEMATITYKGLYGNAAPTANSGNIDMVSYLVVYE